MSQKRLLAVFAHPDDETFGSGSTLARYASEGVDITVVCATRGEAGEIAPGSDATSEILGDVREAELRSALKILGVQSLILLGYRDSGMAGSGYHEPGPGLFLVHGTRIYSHSDSQQRRGER